MSGIIERLTKHREKVKITCRKGCWCWDVDVLLARASQLQTALRKIALWEYDIMGDCVAEATRDAKTALGIGLYLGVAMWKLQIFQNGQWQEFSEHRTGDAAKTAARRTARADTFCGTHLSRYRIIDPAGTPWMVGTKKQCAGWFKIVWAKDE